jgi:uncharacterized membrane protein YfcA
MAVAEMLPFFYVLLFLVAFFYASVGHGGASGYLALMAIFEITPEVMKPTALLLNLFVSLTSFLQFYRSNHFKMAIFLPLAIASVPLSFIGGLMVLEGTVYKKILGVLLLLTVMRLLFFRSPAAAELKKHSVPLALLIGGSIGLLSGMIGIGGGIILSPILLLLLWTDLKQTAAISALFIFVNSIAGLAGQYTKGIHFSSNMIWMVCIAFVGGLCGAYFGALHFKHGVLKKILAAVLLLAVYKLLFTTA